MPLCLRICKADIKIIPEAMRSPADVEVRVLDLPRTNRTGWLFSTLPTTYDSRMIAIPFDEETNRERSSMLIRRDGQREEARRRDRADKSGRDGHSRSAGRGGGAQAS